jgi:hypothetical protein
MIQTLDFLYYFMYQLNRRGYKTNNHENAKLGSAVVSFSILISYKRVVPQIVEHHFEGLHLYDYWTFLIFFISAFIYYLTGKYYGLNGSRKWLIEYYDSSTNIRKYNQYIHVFILTMILIINFLLCLKVGNELKYYFENH